MIESTIDSQRSVATNSELISRNMKDFKHHVCPKCHMIHLITFKNYKINLSDCGNKEHDKNNLLFDEYKNLLQEENLNCENCGRTNKNMYVYYGDNNNIILCKNCKNQNQNQDKIIKYELFNIKCLIHRKNFISYCLNCKKNICQICEQTHQHQDQIIKFRDLDFEINVENRQKFDEFKQEIDDIIGKLNKIKENINYYLEIIEEINHGIKDDNYYIYENIKGINSYNEEIIKDLDEVKKKTNIKEKFNKLIEIYELMTNSNDNSTNNHNNNVNNNVNNNSNDSNSRNQRQPSVLTLNNDSTHIDTRIKIEMKLKYKIDKKLKELKKLKIFGDQFVKNNKCKINFENETAIYNDLLPNENFTELKEEELDNREGTEKEKTINIYLIIENITNLSYMFCDCQNINSLDISGFNNNDFINLKNLSYMFYNCTSLKSLSISEWDSSNVTDMSYAFSNCKSLKSLSNIPNWETKNVESMEGMFRNCINLESIDGIKDWHTSNVKYMNSMFCNCQKLENIDPFSQLDLHNVVDMNNIFAECSNLEDISSFSINNSNSS